MNTKQLEEAVSMEIDALFRGKKIIFPLPFGMTVLEVKNEIIRQSQTETENNPHELSAADLKVVYKGKILSNNETELYSHVIKTTKKLPSNKVLSVKLIVSGVSKREAQITNNAMEQSMKHQTRVKNDMTMEGRVEIAQRKARDRKIRQSIAQQRNNSTLNNESSSSYGFGRIETLPGLPDEHKAKELLTELMNDEGILACMKKRKWFVPTLAELYPEGKVGESPVCVMGLNQNKGQKILLRLRTDDLQGFRKILSIKKVLYHELAHNVHSDHNDLFFQLMRQVERECNTLHYSSKRGYQLNGGNGSNRGEEDQYCSFVSEEDGPLFIGGSGTAGDTNTSANRLEQTMSLRELTARAALLRMTKEEEEIEQYCGSSTNSKMNG